MSEAWVKPYLDEALAPFDLDSSCLFLLTSIARAE